MNSKLSQINSNQIKDEKFNEQWSRWIPIKGLADKYYIDGVLDALDGFKIELSEKNGNKKVRVFFKNSVRAYRNTDESFRQKLISELTEEYGSKFYGDWTFFKVTNSRYLQWLSEQSYEYSDLLGFIHFSLIDDNSILDVVTTYDPIVEIVNER